MSDNRVRLICLTILSIVAFIVMSILLIYIGNKYNTDNIIGGCMLPIGAAWFYGFLTGNI